MSDLTPELARLREEYTRGGLHRHDLDQNPVVQLQRWLEEAIVAQVPEPTAMSLATATRDGAPSVRVVLLKGLDQEGLQFFTNYRSRKALELAENSQAAVCFWWAELQRQARVVGRVEKLPPEISTAYFATRPRGSQLGAWCSPQSAVLRGRSQLDTQLREAEERFAAGDVPCPPFWGGFRLIPHEFELWQGRPSRLHDRFRYRRQDTDWMIERLAP